MVQLNMATTKRRSKLELTFEKILQDNEVDYEYEVTKIPYTVPQSDHKYIVDWTIRNGVLIETKGWLENLTERRKYQLIKEQHPEIDIRFVFANPQKACGGVKMTHEEWALKYGFKYCSINDREQIVSWIKERKRKSK